MAATTKAACFVATHIFSFLFFIYISKMAALARILF